MAQKKVQVKGTPGPVGQDPRIRTQDSLPNRVARVEQRHVDGQQQA